jgi:hypothetical protein
MPSMTSLKIENTTLDNQPQCDRLFFFFNYWLMDRVHFAFYYNHAQVSVEKSCVLEYEKILQEDLCHFG